MNMNVLKSVGAVACGFITVVVLSLLTDSVVESIGILPSRTRPEAYTTWHYLIALFYRTIYTIAGGYVTSLLAPRNTKKLIIILGSIGTIAGIGGVIASLSMPTGQWYAVALAVAAFPSIWLGWKLFENKKKRT
ncbi:MAG: hypothetical protein RLZZ455_1040 [Candidatus Parcubacteria bacterium]|jgi:hypothetical protein